MLALAVLASGAPETKSQDCSDAGRCSVASDHSLLQSKINVHRVDDLGEENAWSCGYFGNCRANLTTDDAQRHLIREIPETPGFNKLAFDCGSSGSNIKIVTADKACKDSVGPFFFETKNDEKKGLYDCTVSKAFQKKVVSPGVWEPVLGPGCASKWRELANWVSQLDGKCFQNPGTTSLATVQVQCWAAGTAGNRLASKQDDLDSWAAFKKWTTDIGLCSVWMPESHTSQLGSLTIPGAMEAAMEVETIIANDNKNLKTMPGFQRGIAFGSAGGSSAQFGICLSCWKSTAIKAPMYKGMPLPATPTQYWQSIVAGTIGQKFPCKNFRSEVDLMQGDYLNTYTASDGSTWAVGSFLGWDKCIDPKTKKWIPAEATTTPMAGMSAMNCGIMGSILKDTVKCPGKQCDIQAVMDAATPADFLAYMQKSGQGKLADAFYGLVTSYFAPQIRQGLLGMNGASGTQNLVRFVAKTFQLIGDLRSQTYTGFEKSTDFSGPYGNGKKMAYAYMTALGLMPQEMLPGMATSKSDIVLNEFINNQKQQSLQVDEYAWLDTAAKIGFNDITCGPGKCTFALPLDPSKGTATVCAR